MTSQVSLKSLVPDSGIITEILLGLPCVIKLKPILRRPVKLFCNLEAAALMLKPLDWGGEQSAGRNLFYVAIPSIAI